MSKYKKIHLHIAQYTIVQVNHMCLPHNPLTGGTSTMDKETVKAPLHVTNHKSLGYTLKSNNPFVFPS